MTKFYKYTRQQLKTKQGKDYKTEDIIRVGKYHVEIHYGSPDPTSPHWNSRVFTTTNIADLKLHQIPGYIKDFLRR